MLLHKIVSLATDQEPLRLAELPIPEPRPGELLIKVSCCGVCHTELDEIEGRTPPPVLPVIPGHEVVGRVEQHGPGTGTIPIGTRVGIGWIHSSSGSDDENLSPRFRATGRDVNGGYAEYLTVPEAYAYPLPAVFSDEEAAPLLCAGAVGYRALMLTNLRDGQFLGFSGFGGSAHIVLQLARHLYPASKFFVFARHQETREFALRLGADWAGGISDRSPELLHAIIDTTPAWTSVMEALLNLRPAGRLVINAIRKEDSDKEQLLTIDYVRHLWLEKEIKSVANVTARDIAAFLAIAAEIPIRPEVQVYDLEEANTALVELKRGYVKGAKLLRIS